MSERSIMYLVTLGDQLHGLLTTEYQSQPQVFCIQTNTYVHQKLYAVTKIPNKVQVALFKRH